MISPIARSDDYGVNAAMTFSLAVATIFRATRRRLHVVEIRV
ncbi:hypothetical protein BIFDEN_00238 [Bifidobacterium dentium ATCC 27678]|nr:hypothetical protein BIFDEN_00238 [Bifidobacterium dentium ATCC 27678]